MSRKRIENSRDLEEGRSYMHDESGKFKKGNEQAKKQEILSLSLR